MQDLMLQEQFEIEALDLLNSKRLLRPLVFGGGTMLRLCYGLDRFSVDLDFWIMRTVNRKRFFADLKECLTGSYTVSDAADKFNTLLFEIRSNRYPRSLKIEVRKELRSVRTNQAIAYSRSVDRQVLVRAVSLEDMMAAKIEALLDRKEIRDAFDIEFLLKKGVALQIVSKTAAKAMGVLDSFTKRDYTVKLGSLLEASIRRYYVSENFRILREALARCIEDIDAQIAKDRFNDPKSKIISGSKIKKKLGI